MSNKLAARHKCSLTLKSPVERSLPSEKKPLDNKRYNSEKDFGVTIFPFVVCLIFLVHWIIVCPLIWALLYGTEFSADWPHFWPYLYWLVAFVVWLTWMVLLIVIWQRHLRHLGLTSGRVFGKPPLETPRYGTNVELVQPETLRLTSVYQDDEEDPSETRRRAIRSKKIKGLAPLVIHRNMSGLSKTENSGEVTIETPGSIDRAVGEGSKEKNGNVTSDAPTSPSSISNGQTDVPLSPRESFFIDLIRSAEKAEAANHSPTSNSRSSTSEKTPSDSRPTGEEPSSYFIANVETRVENKNEIFIEIQEPEIAPRNNNAFEWTGECAHKPKLTMTSVAKKCPSAEDRPHEITDDSH